MKVIKSFSPNVPSGAMRITLCDTHPSVVAAWNESFRGVDPVEIVEGSLLDVDCRALVSPANSFGDMGGGVDQQIDNFFGGAAQHAAMAAIRERFCGELPVGMALILDMQHPRFRFLVVSPTMRIPQGVEDTINAYLSMRAILVAILQHNQADSSRIDSVAVPGLCTGVGGMPHTEAAQQMRVAYDNVIGEGWKQVVSPAMAPYAWRPRGQ